MPVQFESLSAAIDAAKQAAAEKNWAQAMNIFAAIRRLWADAPQGWVGVAEMLRTMQLFDEAEVAGAAAIRNCPNYFPAWLEHAKLAQDRNDWMEAADRWASACAAFPDHMSSYSARAWCLRRAGLRNLAETVLTEAIARFPDQAQLAFDLAVLANEQNDWPAALQRWAAFRDKFPADPRGYAYGAGTFRQLDRLNDAEALLEASRHLPFNTAIAREAALLAARRGDWPEAVKRWRLLFDSFPEQDDAAAGLADAMIEVGAFDDAEAVIQMLRYKGALGPKAAMAYANIATRRGDWAGAMERWNQARHAYPDNKVISGAFMAAKMRILLEQSDSAAVDEGDFGGAEAIPAYAPASMPDEATLASPEALKMRAILGDFESLGDNCEFGIVQRAYGLEPLGLLRWTSTPVRELTDALLSSFEGVGDTEQTLLDTIRGEYLTRDKRFFMHMHTFIHAKEIAEDVVLPKLRKRLKLLRRKLLEDLAEAQKFFLYKSKIALSDVQINNLFAALRSHGDNCLLVVLISDENNLPGVLRAINQNLLVGYIEKFETNDPFLPGWTSLCERAHAVFTELRGKDKNAEPG